MNIPTFFILVLLICIIVPCNSQPNTPTVDKSLLLPTLSIDKSAITISGLSSGAFMAINHAVSYSSIYSGLAMFAGGPYNCASGSLDWMLTACMNDPSLISVTDLIADTDMFWASGLIDNPSNLANSPVYIYAGNQDTVVNPKVGKAAYDYLSRYVPSHNLKANWTTPSEHCIPTLDFGEVCNVLSLPYIGHCFYDGVGDALNFIYPNLKPKSTSSTPLGNLSTFDQSLFWPDSTLQGIAKTGYYYIPKGCASKDANCKLHVALHGCEQQIKSIGMDFILHSGYIPWADTNKIVLLFPQANKIPLINKMGCWDIWGFELDSKIDYMIKTGPQQLFLREIVGKIADIL